MTAVTLARGAPPAPAPDRESSRAATTVGSVALGALVIGIAVLGANAASGPSSYVPSGARSFPGWLAGALAPLGFTTSHAVLEGIVLALCALYAVVLVCLPALAARRVWLAIVLATLAAALAPPLLSGDALGYLGFARLGVLHGLSPYSHTANAAPHDAIYQYLTWRKASAVTTPYGPLFTLLSYALVPLGIAGGLWALKLLAALTTLATLALIWRIAVRLGRSPERAVAMYGLNPVVLVFAVGGAHNDTWFGLAVAAAILALLRAHESRGALATVAATALKVSAVMLMPFALIASPDRRRFLVWLAGALAVALVASVAVFGFSLDGIGHALLSEQRDVARHSLPNEVSKLFGYGYHHLPEWIRISFIAGFSLAVLGTLRAALRGTHWLDCYAWATLALLAASSWLLPWYAMWALLPACVSSSRRLQAGALVASAYCVAIKVL